MPFEVRRRSHRDGSRWASLPRRSGGCLVLAACPLGLPSFEGNLQGVPAPDHPMRARGDVGPLSHATASLSFSACSDPFNRTRSRVVLARRGLPRALTRRMCQGTTPTRSLQPSPGRALARPPGAGFSPAQIAKPVHSSTRALDPTTQPKPHHRWATQDRLPRPNGRISLGAFAHRCAHQSVGLVITLGFRLKPTASLASRNPAAAEPPLFRVASSPRHTARSLGALPISLLRVYSRRFPSFGRSVPTDPSRSVLVVRSPPRRLTPRPSSQAVAPGTGMASLVSTARSRRPPRWFPNEMPGEGCARFPRSVAFTPLEEPASRSLTHAGREP